MDRMGKEGMKELGASQRHYLGGISESGLQECALPRLKLSLRGDKN